MGIKCIYFLVIEIWKLIPNEIKSLTFANSFRKTIKYGLLQTLPAAYVKPTVDVGFITETTQMNICFLTFFFHIILSCLS